MTKYQTIVADPPWPHDGSASMPAMPFAEQRSKSGQPSGLKAIIKPMPYPTMGIEAIRELPVRDFAAEHAWLFMWTTNRHLPDAFDVMVAWGFLYRQTLVWRKTGNPSPLGGCVCPNHAEYLLVGRKGSPRRLGRLESSVIDAPKPSNAHSRKPELFLDLIERVAGGPYLEMFARRNRMGWDTWGNESLNHVEIA